MKIDRRALTLAAALIVIAASALLALPGGPAGFGSVGVGAPGNVAVRSARRATTAAVATTAATTTAAAAAPAAAPVATSPGPTAMVASLPAGCAASGEVFKCGTVYYKPFMSGGMIVYGVVPGP